MNPTLARLLTRLYPRYWRERYGDEFEALLEAGSGDFRTVVNSVWSALCEHIVPTPGLKTDQDPGFFAAIMKRPSAFLPLAMSITALTMVLGDVAIFGVGARQTDEGTVAHLWQILMAGQMPVVAFFAIKWLPRAPRPSLQFLALQAGAILANLAAVFFLT